MQIPNLLRCLMYIFKFVKSYQDDYMYPQIHKSTNVHVLCDHQVIYVFRCSAVVHLFHITMMSKGDGQMRW